jgi:hypothetical protein
MGQDKGVRGVRHRVMYREEPLYVNIFPPKCEIFISSVDRDQDLLTGAALDALGRLTTLGWKTSGLDKVIQQLKRSSKSSRDMPGILANLLEEDRLDICND